MVNRVPQVDPMNPQLVPAVGQGGVFSFISVDCGLRVGDREAWEELWFWSFGRV